MAPMSPPKSACDELEGMPKYQVVKFQATAPMSAASTSAQGHEVGVHEALADRLRDAGVEQRAEEVEARGHDHGDAR